MIIVSRMTAATSDSRLLKRLAGLVDHERSRGFHAGRVTLDLSRMERLLAALPPLPWPRVSVHVAGSEGKTSTTELIAAGLSAHGLLTATYTSPHLRDVRERLRIGGRLPPEALVDHAVDVVAAAAASGPPPSFFEFLTATARVLYAEAGVDAVVWETGLGGRLDATRLVRADVCAITTISLEHTAILGPTIAAIAAEKAGILRPRAPVALGAGVPEAAQHVIEQAAAALCCPVHRVRARGADVRQDARALARLVLDLVASLDLVPLRTASVDAAIERHAVEGRFQRVGNVLFDGAHSLAACVALARELAPLRPARVVFGATSGRDAAAMAAALRPAAERLLLTRPPGERGVDPTELLPALGPDERVSVVPEPAAALRAARQHAGASRLVVVTGSLYLVGRLLAELDPGAGDAAAPAEYRSA